MFHVHLIGKMIENLNMAGLLQLEGTQKKASNEPITLTDAAVQKMKVHQASLAEAKGKSLRIYITAGGCSGYSYNFKYDQAKENDLTFEKNGVNVLVDPKSYALISGATLDYHEGLTGAGFTLNNPNQTGGCGCGSSFSM